jgi:hypothetical protein
MQVKIADGFFVTSSGDLCRDSHDASLVREGYAQTHQVIRTGREFRETLRAGEYAWPGGYPIYFHMSDGESLCFDCGHSEAPQIIRSIRDHGNEGWRVVGADVYWEGPDMHCSHCNKSLPSAYGNPDEGEGE